MSRIALPAGVSRASLALRGPDPADQAISHDIPK
jgi:hypothetical protein